MDCKRDFLKPLSFEEKSGAYDRKGRADTKRGKANSWQFGAVDGIVSGSTAALGAILVVVVFGLSFTAIDAVKPARSTIGSVDGNFELSFTAIDATARMTADRGNDTVGVGSSDHRSGK